MSLITTTLDGLLNRRVTLEQPAQGYRVAIDTVFLAAAVPAHSGDHILDMGCGAGGALLCLAARVAHSSGLGIDIQADLIDLCRRNIKRAIFAGGFAAKQGDAANLPPGLSGVFDQVMFNPPFHDKARHDASPHDQKKLANSDGEGDLAAWIKSAAHALKPAGCLTLINRADRRDEIIDLLRPEFGHVEILHLLPKQGVVAKRVILRAHKGAFFSVKENPPFILHQANGRYTSEADKILRDGAALSMPRS